MWKRFEGLIQAEYKFFETFFPSQQTGRGRLYAEFIKVLNTIIWILLNGAKWINVPKGGEEWAPKSTAYDWLGKWQADGTWEKILFHIVAIAESAGLINWERASVDGAFVAGKGGEAVKMCNTVSKARDLPSTVLLTEMVCRLV